MRETKGNFYFGWGGGGGSVRSIRPGREGGAGKGVYKKEQMGPAAQTLRQTSLDHCGLLSLSVAYCPDHAHIDASLTGYGSTSRHCL